MLKSVCGFMRKWMTCGGLAHRDVDEYAGSGLWRMPKGTDMMDIFILFMVGSLSLFFVNRISYVFLKNRILRRQCWGLNVCCGKTDGGGINADIVKHNPNLKGFHKITDVYRLPFSEGKFQNVLCSHTVEHVDQPEELDSELSRVGRRVVYIVPPLWDIAAAFNVFEHKWIFLTFRKEHTRLPKYVRLPFARTVQGLLGQRIVA